MIVIGLIVLIFLAIAYVGLPLWAKLVVLAINSFFPDPIPVLDEVLMFAATINDIVRIHKAMIIPVWIRSHKVLSVCIGLGTVVLIAVAVSLLIN